MSTRHTERPQIWLNILRHHAALDKSNKSYKWPNLLPVDVDVNGRLFADGVLGHAGEKVARDQLVDSRLVACGRKHSWDWTNDCLWIGRNAVAFWALNYAYFKVGYVLALKLRIVEILFPNAPTHQASISSWLS